MFSDPQTPKYSIRRSSSSPPPIVRKHSNEMVYYDADDFIKPDPAMTRSETRRYILDELTQCLTKRLMARLEHWEEPTMRDSRYLHTTSNPLDRLYHVSKMLLEQHIEESVGEVSATILEQYLNCDPLDYEKYSYELIKLVLGFVLVDRLPCDRTIYTFWNHSPFQALRNAPPLTDEAEPTEFHDALRSMDTPSDENILVIRMNIHALLVILAAITVWIALTVYQLAPVRTTYP